MAVSWRFPAEFRLWFHMGGCLAGTPGVAEVAAGRTLVVSEGVGCVVLPLRLFADPEIVVCNLTTATRVKKGDHRGSPIVDPPPREAPRTKA